MNTGPAGAHFPERLRRRRFCVAAASVTLAIGSSSTPSTEMARDNHMLVSMLSRLRS